MARRPSKAKIEASLTAYAEWRTRVDTRLTKIKTEPRVYLTEWADDVRTRIESGELGACTQALIRSVERDLHAWETGFFARMDGTARVHA